ncbi:hypothetical protein Tcan_15044 [Toxocara canis]|uniref:Uncharacterized protein n=1 Tax=Toxocara canis TaxID=6265 RepID=A0A0B2VST0_TOXCA|nr:hypothetical protein Tcan_15044 [Toxocara canis]
MPYTSNASKVIRSSLLKASNLLKTTAKIYRAWKDNGQVLESWAWLPQFWRGARLEILHGRMKKGAGELKASFIYWILPFLKI